MTLWLMVATLPCSLEVDVFLGSSVDHGGCSSIFNHCRSHGHGADSAETSEDQEELDDVACQEHEGGEGEQADYSWILWESCPDFSLEKWIFEKGGRWVVDDYDEVLHALRTLYVVLISCK